jgi:biotin transport system substrate-specific component
MPTTRTRQMTAAALIAALLAASAFVTVPLQPVPITFQVLVVILAALLLEPGWAAAAVGVYLLLGTAGAPVFAGMRGGFGVLLGPTGGYLWGFLFGATLASVFRKRARGTITPGFFDAVSAVIVVIVVYFAGWLWLARVAHLGLGAAAVAGVLPFLPLDALKAVAAVVVAAALRRAGLARA